MAFIQYTWHNHEIMDLPSELSSSMCFRRRWTYLHASQDNPEILTIFSKLSSSSVSDANGIQSMHHDIIMRLCIHHQSSTTRCVFEVNGIQFHASWHNHVLHGHTICGSQAWCVLDVGGTRSVHHDMTMRLWMRHLSSMHHDIIMRLWIHHRNCRARCVSRSSMVTTELWSYEYSITAWGSMCFSMQMESLPYTMT